MSFLTQSWWKKLTSGYSALALVFLNTVVAFAFLNVVLWVAFAIYDRSPVATIPWAGSKTTPSGLFYENGTAVEGPKRSMSNQSIFDFKAYEGTMTEREIGKLLDEIYDHSRLGFSYEPYTQYAPKPFRGTYLNIEKDQYGFAVRKSINPKRRHPDRPPIEIFTFGGSTTFGFGVSDVDTWPTTLSAILNAQSDQLNLGRDVIVKNYGRVGYYPTQELHFLMALVRRGARPDLVVFLDGVNLGRHDDTPNYSVAFAKAIERKQSNAFANFDWLPAQQLVRRLMPNSNSRARVARPGPEQLGPLYVERFVQFEKATRLFADGFGISTLMLLQPDGYRHYPQSLRGQTVFVSSKLKKMTKEVFYRTFPKNAGFVDLTHLFEAFGHRKSLVDMAHYSPNFSAFLAENISKEIDLVQLSKKPKKSARPTGIAR